jgi:hypothetical protein
MDKTLKNSDSKSAVTLMDLNDKDIEDKLTK